MAQTLHTMKLEVTSDTLYIDAVQAMSEKLFEVLGFKQDVIYWMSLALREAINNAVKHGNQHDPSKKVTVDFSIYPDKINIIIRDEGEGFEFSEIPDPTTRENVFKASGRGIFYMKSFMDKIEYLENGKSGCVLSLTKFREKAERTNS